MRYVYDGGLVEKEPDEHGNIRLTPLGEQFAREKILSIKEMFCATPEPQASLVAGKGDESDEVVRTLENLGRRDSSGDHEVIRIKFQSGPIGEVGVNGCQIENVIDVLIERLYRFQGGAFPCAENSNAVEFLRKAKEQMELRTVRRVRQGVEGKMELHKS